MAGAAAVGIGYQTLPTHPYHPAPAKRLAGVHGRAVAAAPALVRPRPGHVAVASTVRRPELRRASAPAPRAAHKVRARPGTSHATTSTIAQSSVSNVSEGGSSSTATTSHGDGHAGNGKGHAAPTVPASHGNQKPFKGNGHAYGRSKPKKVKPAPAAQNGNGPPAIPPGQLKSHQNNGKGNGQ